MYYSELLKVFDSELIRFRQISGPIPAGSPEVITILVLFGIIEGVVV